jgi:hypothetical protein
MNRLLPGIALLAAVLIGCSSYSQPRIKGSGKVASETRSVPAFSGIALAGAFDLTIVRGSEVAVVIETDVNLLPEIATTVESGTLRIRPSRDISPSSRVAVRITHPSPTGVSVAGSGQITAEDLAADQFNVDVAGSAKIRLAGTARKLNISISGSADIQSDSLEAQDVVIRIAGSANAEVNARQSLDARVSGSGKVVYSGSPASVQTSISGSGSVRAK